MDRRRGVRAIALLLWIVIASFTIWPSLAASETVGWRMDGTGDYSDCRPPEQIGPEANVAWQTPLANWSNASPIMVANRIFICAEPYDILCVDASSGKILWQKSNSYSDLENPTTEMARKIQKEIEQDSILIEQEKRIGKELRNLRREARADTGNAALKTQINKKREKLKNITQKRDALLLAGKCREWPTHKTNGHSSRTLSSDGEHVFGAFGNGMVVCYDLNGTLKWHVQHKPIFHDWGGSTSPTLVLDRVIVHFDDHYFAHRISDGKELWRFKSSLVYGTPVVTDLDGTAILVTPQGVLLDVERGEAFCEPVFKPLPYAAPLVKDGVIYALGHKNTLCTAVQLPKSVGSLQRNGARVLWSKAIKKDRYYGTPVIHNGLLYAITRNHTLTVLDVTTGETVYAKRVSGLKGHSYMSPTEAGGRIYLNGEKGSLVVLQSGREYVEIARSQFAPFRTTPIFADNRMFLRSSAFLYCFQQQ